MPSQTKLLSSLTRASSIMNHVRKILFLIFVLTLFTPHNAQALQLRSANVRVPEHCLLDVSPGIVIPFRNKKGEFKIYFLKGKFLPIKLTLIDPNGITKTYEYKDPSQLIDLTI